MSETMRRQIEAEACAARGKLPPVAGVACARPAGFPTAAARSSDITEARAGARRDDSPAVGIPEGGNSPASHGHLHGTPRFFLTDQLSGEAVGESPGLPHPASAPEVQAVIQSVRQAAKRPRKLYLFELTEREFLHAHSAVEHDRNKTRKAIAKGQATPQDLKASESLWHKLQACLSGCFPTYYM